LSQYPFPPSPYSPPGVNPGHWNYGQPHGPARTAALLQIILGGILVMFGTCVGSLIWIVPDDVLNKVVQQQQANFPPMSGYSPVQEFRILCAISLGLMLLAGTVLLILAFFVRRGGQTSAVISIVANSLVGLCVLIDLAVNLGQVAGNPANIFSLLILIGVAVLVGFTIAKLIVSLRSSGSAQMRAMQQTYYWAMQQQQASGGFGQSGYGYGSPASPPPQPPATQGPLPPPPNA
jgi:hypothetical protein